MQSDIIIDPVAVVVELVSTSIARHAVFRIVKDVAIADSAEVLIIFLAKLNEAALFPVTECSHGLLVESR